MVTALDQRSILRGTALTLVVAVALAAAAVIVVRPLPVVIGVVAIATLAAMMLRIEWAVLFYLAAEPFGDYLTTLSSDSVKAIGAVLFIAWLLRLAINSRPIALRHPATYAAGGLFLALLAAFVLNPNGAAGIEVMSRYGSYLAVLVVLADSMRTGLAPRRAVTVFVISCSASAVVGLVGFLNSGGGRAAGPMQDANDFAFYLVCALPFAVYLWRSGAGRSRYFFAVAAGVLAVTILATFSRGAVVGIVAMVAVAAALGVLRLRQVLAGGLVIALAVGIVVVLAPAVVHRSLQEKGHVAEANVASRFTSWTMAAEMTADRPVLGMGPGGFRTHFEQYIHNRPVDQTHLDVAHQMYLDVGSELGLTGLAAFVAMLGYGAAGALRASKFGPDSMLGKATCIAFAGTLVAAIFLSEQYYLPIWLLVAIGVALDPRTKGIAPCALSS